MARTGASYVLTTGTGSGKSLAYIIPIIDAVLRERAANAGRRPGRYLCRDGTGLGGSLKSDDAQTLRRGGAASGVIGNVSA